jgi:hypothetical protein
MAMGCTGSAKTGHVMASTSIAVDDRAFSAELWHNSACLRALWQAMMSISGDKARVNVSILESATRSPLERKSAHANL